MAGPRLSARLRLWLLFALLALGVPAWAASGSVHIEDLTWTELRARIDAGATTILVPIGGTEQNGPHMVLGKHNVRARALAERIAQQLGNALVAPVMAYVPEGGIDPPQAHMRFAGTLSIPEPAFEAVLEATARSFKRHGFREVVFLGDHGGYQKSEERVAARLNREWGSTAAPPCRVHALAEYYRAATAGFAEILAARGFGKAEIGSHAGLSDTALAMAIDEALVRKELLGNAQKTGEKEGVYGDPRRATAELGQLGAQRIVEASVAAIRERTRAR
jgi:creatinine amidohydrolase/Fe(II)-dependent formamide hydrolase-like protein